MALDSDPRRDPAWWTNPIVLEVEELESSPTSFEFRYLSNPLSDAPLVLLENRGHSIRLTNRSDTRRHALAVPQLYARSVFLSLEDSQVEVRLPHPNSVGVKAGKEATVHLVPTPR